MTDYTIPVEADEQANNALALVERALAVSIIITDREYGSAGTMLMEIKQLAKGILDTELSITRPINDGLKKIRDFFRVPRQRLGDAELALENARAAYRRQVEAQKREAERIAEAAARKERDRLELQAAKLEEDARKKREAEEAKARALEEAGNVEKAEATRRASEDKAKVTAQRAAALRHVKDTWPTAPIVHREAPKTLGVHTVTRWSARVVDKSALIKAVAAGQVPETVLVPDMVALNRMAVALKEQLNYPGVVPESTQTESVRT